MRGAAVMAMNCKALGAKQSHGRAAQHNNMHDVRKEIMFLAMEVHFVSFYSALVK